MRGSGYFRGSPISRLVVVSSHHPSSSSPSVCLLRCPRHHRLMPPSPVLLVPVSRLVFACHCLIALLPVLSTSRTGRSLLACLVRCGFLPLVSFSSSRVPVLACPTEIALVVLVPALRRRHPRSCLVALPFVSSPRSSTSGGGARVAARSLLACLFRSRLRFPCRACVRAGCHRRRMACGWGVGVAPCLPWDGGGRCGVGCGCVRFVVGVFVYMNLVLARVS